jgi:hypothetical protein
MEAADEAIAAPLAFDALDASPAEIRARFRQARVRGHPGYVWPELPIETWRACGGAIERVTRARLTRPGVVARLEAPAGATATAVGIAAFSAGMGPLLGLWIERGEVRASAGAAGLLALHLAHGRAGAERRRAALVAALDALRDAGIEATVVKAAHTGDSYFPEAGVRPAADVDLVIAPGAIARTEALLAAAGFTRGTRQSQPYKCDWIPPGSPRTLPSLELAHEAAPFAIEVHDSLERVFFGVRHVAFPVDEHTTRPLPTLHPAARALAQPVLTAFLATHASEELHHLQLVRLVELALVIRQDVETGALVWGELAALLDEAGALRFAFPALELAERLAPGTLDPGFRMRLAAAATPRMRRIVGGLSPASALRPDRLSLEDRFLWTSGAAETLRRAAYLLWPSHAARSSRPLHVVYAERLYRLVRGRISLRSSVNGGAPR